MSPLFEKVLGYLCKQMWDYSPCFMRGNHYAHPLFTWVCCIGFLEQEEDMTPLIPNTFRQESPLTRCKSTTFL